MKVAALTEHAIVPASSAVPLTLCWLIAVIARSQGIITSPPPIPLRAIAAGHRKSTCQQPMCARHSQPAGRISCIAVGIVVVGLAGCDGGRYRVRTHAREPRTPAVAPQGTATARAMGGSAAGAVGSAPDLPLLSNRRGSRWSRDAHEG
jgi:hypothetical protein